MWTCAAARQAIRRQRQCRATGGTGGRGERAPGASGVGSGGLAAAPARWPVGESPNRGHWVGRWGDGVGASWCHGRAWGVRVSGIG